MDPQYFKEHLHDILSWWEDLIDWKNGGVFTQVKPLVKEPSHKYKSPLMHLRQMYNYSVGHEFGHPNAEKIARHLSDSLFEVFPERQGALMISTEKWRNKNSVISGYLNAYQVICLSRYARTFRHRPSAELALTVYHEMDALLTDGRLAEQGTWDLLDLKKGERQIKTDNAHIHRCEGAFNLLRALEVCAPELAEKERNYLSNQVSDLCRYFDRHITRPEEGYTVEKLADDSSPVKYYEYDHQSLAHGFEWLGFCEEIERYVKIPLPFEDQRLYQLCRNTLDNGLTANGCFQNDYSVFHKASSLSGCFWPQVEAILGALWARKRWGESAFPLEKSERMLDFYQKYFMIPEFLGGGIASNVSANGVPTNFTTGHQHKCDHHAVRMIEKTLEFDLLGVVPK
ncbi:AGE family epimerase/isomerase [Kiritimatiellaeota bacterium B1221]|nr:AGE family epimerase/isomerase [Kiritimatiellaeota bacterium B1221]